MSQAVGVLSFTLYYVLAGAAAAFGATAMFAGLYLMVGRYQAWRRTTERARHGYDSDTGHAMLRQRASTPPLPPLPLKPITLRRFLWRLWWAFVLVLGLAVVAAVWQAL